MIREDNNNSDSPSPRTILSAFYKLTQSSRRPRDWNYDYPHFTEGESEARGTCERSLTSKQGQVQAVSPRVWIQMFYEPYRIWVRDINIFGRFYMPAIHKLLRKKARIFFQQSQGAGHKLKISLGLVSFPRSYC